MAKRETKKAGVQSAPTTGSKAKRLRSRAGAATAAAAAAPAAVPEAKPPRAQGGNPPETIIP